MQESELRRVGDGVTRKVDIRLIAATNKDLEADVKRGTFREDLFYRINVIPIHVPPLRERKGDIELLTEYLVAKYSGKMRKTVTTVSKRALAMMMNYEWPGNVRELENVIQRAVALATTDEIEPNLLPGELSSSLNRARHSKTKTARLAQVERETILKTLEQMQGNKKRTAEVLGISKATLWRKLKYISDESEEVH
ncbi:sigma-54-dependent Fis family transcriptional regulator [Candidatus Parcubacteria bacterium]|nr:MAG: sigma-54-dependent Fis family transcriptional regulator [Candidatus Parcubacteria bacterium]